MSRYDGWDASRDDFSKRNDTALFALKGVLEGISEVTGKAPAALVGDAMRSVLVGGNKLGKNSLYHTGRDIRPTKGQIFRDMGGRFTAHGVTFAAKGVSGGVPQVLHGSGPNAVQVVARRRFQQAGAFDKKGRATSIFVRVTGHDNADRVRLTPVRVTKTGKLGGTRRTKGEVINGSFSGASLDGSTLGYRWRGKAAKLDGVVRVSLLQYTLFLDFERRRSSIGYYSRTFYLNSKDGSLDALGALRRRAAAGANISVTGQIRTTDKRGTRISVDYRRATGKGGDSASYARGHLLGITRFEAAEHNPNRYASGLIEAVVEDRIEYLARKLKISVSELLGKRFGGTAFLGGGTGNKAVGEAIGKAVWDSPDPF